MTDARHAAEIARISQELTVLEARLIAARHLRLADRVRLIESELRRLEVRLAALQGRCPPRDRSRH